MGTQRRGLVMVFTGDGKGKTTAAFGQALRAVGRGMRVAVVQFIKSRRSPGEIRAAAKLAPALTVHICGAGYVHGQTGPRPVDLEAARKGVDLARRLMTDPDLDMLILDEITVAAHLNLIDPTTLLHLVDAKPPRLHLVLTGRWAPLHLIERADLVTEMREVKHHWRRGVPEQLGVED
jgi:cob(I)alamin adenosyltransferase